DARGYLVHAESRRADDHTVLLGAAEGAHDEIDAFVAAASGQNLLGCNAVNFGKMLDELGRLRFGIAIESRFALIAARRPRHLVRVQAFERRLPCSVLVGLQREDVGTRELENLVHCGSRVAGLERCARRTCTALACASKPSSVAMSIAVGPKSFSPSGVISCTVMRFMKSTSERPL